MKRLIRSASLLSILVLVAPIAFSQSGSQREKLAEGQYSDWKDGQPIQDTTQSWTMWRTADGFELEDHLPPNKGALIMGALEKGLGSKMSPEMHRDIQDAVVTTDIHLRLAKDRSILGLALEGTKMNDSKAIELAQCQATAAEIACTGRAGKAHLKSPEQERLSYSYPFPLLFAPLLPQADRTPNQPTALTLAVLEGEDKKLALNEVSGQITCLGQDDVLLGERKFQAKKYIIAMETKTGPWKVTIWASDKGIVLVMEDSALSPGLRVLLTQYKKYSDF